MSEGGWIKLYRKIQDDALYKDLTAVQRDIMINILLMVNHQPSEWIFEGKKYTCQAGQLITSLKSIKEKCSKEVSIQQVRTCLLKLEKYGFLTSKSTNKNRLITIANWEVYQGDASDVTSNLTSNQQADNKQLTTNKNVRNKELYNDISKDISSSDSESQTMTFDVEPDSLKSDVEKVIEAWNSVDEFRKVKRVSTESRRYKATRARIKEYGVDAVIECVHVAERSSFLKTSKFFDYEWLMRPENFAKTFEGKYSDRGDKHVKDRFSGMAGRDVENRKREIDRGLYDNEVF